MGTLSTTKVLKSSAGQFAEETTLTTSAGAGDANKLPALNASGVLDLTITNGKVVSVGAGDTGKLVALDGSGRIESSVLPGGLGADTQSITASEALSAGDFVNIWDSAGAKVRKADATTSGKEAMGFVLSAVSNGAQPTVKFEGTNTAVTGKTAGKQFLSTPAGACSSTAPVGSGNVAQEVGFATSATTVNFQYSKSILLA